MADGRVLVAGGWVEGFSSAAGARDAALFDPASGATTPTGPMTGGRAGHVATRLHDGRVLIVGGIGTSLPDGDARSLASGELYDPGSGTFAVTSEMACARSAWLNEQFAATVLPSGRVLVSGGVISEACSDEIYDPTTGNFDSILSAGPRDGVSTVVLLFPNRVYRYDLRTGTAADITPQPEGLVRKFGNHCRDLPFDCRVGTTTTRLTDGRVLLVGGSTYEDSPLGFKPQKRVALTSGEVLDPTSGALEPTGSLVEPRSGHTATLLADGRVLIIGGEGEQLEPRILLSSAEIFTPD